MVGPDDGVKLPVADLRTLFNMRWALINGPLIGNAASALSPTGAAAFLVRLLAAQKQVPTATSPFVTVDVTINRFMADVQKDLQFARGCARGSNSARTAYQLCSGVIRALRERAALAFARCWAKRTATIVGNFAVNGALMASDLLGAACAADRSAPLTGTGVVDAPAILFRGIEVLRGCRHGSARSTRLTAGKSAKRKHKDGAANLALRRWHGAILSW